MLEENIKRPTGASIARIVTMLIALSALVLIISANMPTSAFAAQNGGSHSAETTTEITPTEKETSKVVLTTQESSAKKTTKETATETTGSQTVKPGKSEVPATPQPSGTESGVQQNTSGNASDTKSTTSTKQSVSTTNGSTTSSAASYRSTSTAESSTKTTATSSSSSGKAAKSDNANVSNATKTSKTNGSATGKTKNVKNMNAQEKALSTGSNDSTTHTTDKTSQKKEDEAEQQVLASEQRNASDYIAQSKMKYADSISPTYAKELSDIEKKLSEATRSESIVAYKEKAAAIFAKVKEIQDKKAPAIDAINKETTTYKSSFSSERLDVVTKYIAKISSASDISTINDYVSKAEDLIAKVKLLKQKKDLATKDLQTGSNKYKTSISGNRTKTLNKYANRISSSTSEKDLKDLEKKIDELFAKVKELHKHKISTVKGINKKSSKYKTSISPARSKALKQYSAKINDAKSEREMRAQEKNANKLLDKVKILHDKKAKSIKSIKKTKSQYKSSISSDRSKDLNKYSDKIGKAKTMDALKKYKTKTVNIFKKVKKLHNQKAALVKSVKTNAKTYKSSISSNTLTKLKTYKTKIPKLKSEDGLKRYKTAVVNIFKNVKELHKQKAALENETNSLFNEYNSTMNGDENAAMKRILRTIRNAKNYREASDTIGERDLIVARASLSRNIDAHGWSWDKINYVREWGERNNNYLSGTAMEGTGYFIARAAWDNDMDPRICAAIACVESGCGSAPYGCAYNVWGWIWNPPAMYSWEDAIDKWTSYFSQFWGGEYYPIQSMHGYGGYGPGYINEQMSYI